MLRKRERDTETQRHRDTEETERRDKTNMAYNLAIEYHIIHKERRRDRMCGWAGAMVVMVIGMGLRGCWMIVDGWWTDGDWWLVVGVER